MRDSGPSAEFLSSRKLELLQRLGDLLKSDILGAKTDMGRKHSKETQREKDIIIARRTLIEIAERTWRTAPPSKHSFNMLATGAFITQRITDTLESSIHNYPRYARSYTRESSTFIADVDEFYGDKPPRFSINLNESLAVAETMVRLPYEILSMGLVKYI
ncbi:hypothetical protein MGYG_05359 [Nannizzia gypsea CBS 118893]|uniref:Uncharacterized protein n=1 Tax=Arthroderma gypseum (strain ATCC MYA-4604 / CBS 118893) TaxID=535722 RepID=E4UVN5_ARTGP|nr:hypothetical protein MGYG_05359 [Nannizzia gypsea CBS 118893]EFR02362.1 hypothetical protein MGYG_05359 [Nannizzia gypsea CBS 118893]